jgi:hypothetical protein
MTVRNRQEGIMAGVGESGTVAARPPVSKLVDEIFEKVQASQGWGFFSDGEGYGLTHQQYFEHVRTRLRHNVEAVKIIKAFLRKYGEL